VDDGTLIRGTLAGRTHDFEVLVERYQKMIQAFASRLLLDRDEADDATQATFLRAYAELGRFRGEASFKTWLHQIALNECRTRRRPRRSARLVPLDEVPEAALPATSAPNPGSGLERLVARLPPRQRAVVTLRIASDLAFRDIAQVEGISENAAKVSYHHAISRLRRWLAGER
jgi:RNA polymerase sigma-70 factor (ECF subfamily)